jgi:hypothetical protein
MTTIGSLLCWTRPLERSTNDSLKCVNSFARSGLSPGALPPSPSLREGYHLRSVDFGSPVLGAPVPSEGEGAGDFCQAIGVGS